MPFCSSCGYQVMEGEKFCEKCGTPIRINGGGNTTRKKVYEGTIHKCPNCGNSVRSFDLLCSSCGFEFRDSHASEAIKELENGLKKIINNSLSYQQCCQKQASLISSFAIPTNKKDIMELAVFASSNISPDLHTGIIPEYMKEQEYLSKKELSDAWYSKLKQIKAIGKITFKDDNDKQIIDEMVSEVEKKISKATSKAKWKERKTAFTDFLARNKESVDALASILSVIILFLFLFILYKAFC